MTTPQFTMPRDMSEFSTLEAAMLQAIHAAGLPEPVAEHPFDKCCPHPKKDHHSKGQDEPYCNACSRTLAALPPDEWQDYVWHVLHEYRKGRAWRFDFAWPQYRLAVECEGGTWSGGRHTRGDGFEKDTEKYSEAAIQGWLVIRVTGDQIDDGRALALVERALAQRMEAR